MNKNIGLDENTLDLYKLIMCAESAKKAVTLAIQYDKDGFDPISFLDDMVLRLNFHGESDTSITDGLEKVRVLLDLLKVKMPSIENQRLLAEIENQSNNNGMTNE